MRARAARSSRKSSWAPECFWRPPCSRPRFPPAGRSSLLLSPRSPPSEAALVADLVVTVSATPTRAGDNTFTVLVASSQRPPPAPVDGVSLEIRNGGSPTESIPLQEVEPNRYFGTAALVEARRSAFTVVVNRSGERLQVPFSWSIGPVDPARPVTFSSRPLAPLLSGTAAFLLALTLAGLVWILAGRPPLRGSAAGVAGRMQERVR